MLASKFEKTRETDLCPRSLQRAAENYPSSMTERALSTYTLALFSQLLVWVARLVKLLGQISKDLKHFRVVYHLHSYQGLKAVLDVVQLAVI